MTVFARTVTKCRFSILSGGLLILYLVITPEVIIVTFLGQNRRSALFPSSIFAHSAIGYVLQIELDTPSKLFHRCECVK